MSRRLLLLMTAVLATHARGAGRVPSEPPFAEPTIDFHFAGGDTDSADEPHWKRDSEAKATPTSEKRSRPISTRRTERSPTIESSSDFAVTTSEGRGFFEQWGYTFGAQSTFLHTHQLAASLPTTIPLSSFTGDANSGSVRTGTSWEGNVTQGAASITVGGTARDDNGWGRTGMLLDVSGMNSITITAARNAGNAAGSLFLQLEDLRLVTSVFSVDTSLISFDTPTQVYIAVSAWPSGFDPTQVTGWSIGGGGVGTQDFRMTLYEVGFSATAIPEPAEITTALGLAALAAAAYRRRIVQRSASSRS
jgi:hypothetical protein